MCRYFVSAGVFTTSTGTGQVDTRRHSLWVNPVPTYAGVMTTRSAFCELTPPPPLLRPADGPTPLCPPPGGRVPSKGRYELLHLLGSLGDDARTQRLVILPRFPCSYRASARARGRAVRDLSFTPRSRAALCTVGCAGSPPRTRTSIFLNMRLIVWPPRLPVPFGLVRTRRHHHALARATRGRICTERRRVSALPTVAFHSPAGAPHEDHSHHTERGLWPPHSTTPCAPSCSRNTEFATVSVEPTHNRLSIEYDPAIVDDFNTHADHAPLRRVPGAGCFNEWSRSVPTVDAEDTSTTLHRVCRRPRERRCCGALRAAPNTATNGEHPMTTTNEWFETLKDGRRVLIRPIRRDDVHRNAAFLDSLSPPSKHFLFLGGVARLSERRRFAACAIPTTRTTWPYVALDARSGDQPAPGRRVSVCGQRLDERRRDLRRGRGRLAALRFGQALVEPFDRLRTRARRQSTVFDGLGSQTARMRKLARNLGFQ